MTPVEQLSRAVFTVLDSTSGRITEARVNAALVEALTALGGSVTVPDRRPRSFDFVDFERRYNEAGGDLSRMAPKDADFAALERRVVAASTYGDLQRPDRTYGDKAEFSASPPTPEFMLSPSFEESDKKLRASITKEISGEPTATSPAVAIYEIYREENCGWCRVTKDVYDDNPKTLSRIRYENPTAQPSYGLTAEEERIRDQGRSNAMSPTLRRVDAAPMFAATPEGERARREAYERSKAARRADEAPVQITHSGRQGGKSWARMMHLCKNETIEACAMYLEVLGKEQRSLYQPAHHLASRLRTLKDANP